MASPAGIRSHSSERTSLWTVCLALVYSTSCVSLNDAGIHASISTKIALQCIELASTVF